MSELPLLDVKNLEAWYGETQVLRGLTFNAKQGEIVVLLGRNGAGKTTTLRSIMGIVARRKGEIIYKGGSLMRLASDRIARRGIAYCPEERGIFASLSVDENLMLPPVVQPGGLGADEIYDLFPNLKERKNNPGMKLSGGEQQMLAIGRTLRTGAQLVLLDEPTEGLAPVVVKQIGRAVRLLREKGRTVLLVEQNFHFVISLGDRFYVVENGTCVDSLERTEVAANQHRLERLLGL
jgi:branched-chain amino acid transport system ATP-binding protein